MTVHVDQAVEKIRSFALIGHAGDGKTSLGESLLHRAGATETLGSVAEGTSVLNCLPEERDGHTHSIASHPYTFETADHRFTLVDTPGDPNFQGDALVSLQAVDGAVVVVSGVDGAKAGTEKLLKAAHERGASTLAFVNGLDREQADFGRAIDSLGSLEENAVAVAFPIGSGEDLRGVVDVLHMKAVIDGRVGEIPDELSEEALSRREALMEAVAETDDELLEKYLEEGELSDDEIVHALVAGTRKRAVLPVLCGSALTGIGVDLLLRDLVELLPSPVERGEWEAGDELVAPDPEGPFAAVVFKTIIDRYAGTLSVFRVVSGTLASDSPLTNATREEKLRGGKLLRLLGEKHEEVDAAVPGDVVAITKLKGVHTGDALAGEKSELRLPALELPEGVLSYAVGAASGDDDKVFTALGRLVEEDPALSLGREESTGEFLLTGMGELHIRTSVQKLRRMFDMEVELQKPKVPYRETVTKRVENVEGKLKKQTGGAGMFAVCYIDLEPLPRGEGFEFEDRIVGGAIPRGLVPAVEKGIQEACVRGPLAGFPVVDIRVACVDGKYHSVDSNEMAFKLAGSFALKAAMEKAGAILLEPFMSIEVVVPDEYVGDVMGDMSSRRGLVQSTESKGHASIISAKAPMAELLEYASILTSMTGGKGEFHMSFSHYDGVPAKLAEKIILSRQSGANES